MNATAVSFDRARRPLTAVIDAVPAGRWADPSPCEGWTARDVVRHLVETQRDLLLPHGVELGAAPAIDDDPAAAWREHAQRVAEAIADDAVPATTYDGFFGPTTLGATLEQYYVFDLLVHRWDIARAAGLDAGLSDDELDRIAAGADSFGDALYLDGVCKPGVEAGPDASREARVLATLGRSA